MPRMAGGKGATSLVRRKLDGLVWDLVDDVERLERPGLPGGLLLDDADLLLAIHCLCLRRRAAGAVVGPARLEAHADADVGVTREEADRARPVGVPSAAPSLGLQDDRRGGAAAVREIIFCAGFHSSTTCTMVVATP